MSSAAAQQGVVARPPVFYRPELDVLRFLAFFAVFQSHALPQEPSYYVEHGVPAFVATTLAAVSAAGVYGVDLFFCLSSYLITELLLREVSLKGSLDVRSFYVRRMLRIWPLYFLFTAIALMLPYFDHHQLFGWKHALAFLLFSGNWIWAFKFPVFSVAAPLWSVSIEEQFYIVWPWIVRKAAPATVRRVAFCLIGVACFTRIVIYLKIWDSEAWNNTFARLDPIALGAIVAISLNGKCLSAGRGKRIAIAAIGLLGVVVAGDLLQREKEVVMLLTYPLAAISCAVILVAAIGFDVNTCSRTGEILVYLGRISYGLYVFHLFCLYLVKNLWTVSGLQISAVVASSLRASCALGLTIALSAASYRWLESPFLKRKSRFTHVASGQVSLVPQR